MKRDLDNLDLRGAFKPMPDECRNALITAACSVKEEEPVKRITIRTVLIAACIIIATMAIAVAAGQIFGWTDFFSEYYGSPVPETAQQIMKASGTTTFTIGPVIFDVGGLYCDGYIATSSTVARLADGNTALLTGDDPYDAIGANGENGENVAEKLGVDPDISWADAAKQLDLPLYSVRATLEIPEELVGGEQYEDPMFNEDGSLTYFSCAMMNGKAYGENVDCEIWLRVAKVNLDNSEADQDAVLEKKDIPIYLEAPIDTKDYNFPENTVIGNKFRLDSVKGILMPAGLYMFCNYTALDGATEDDAYDALCDSMFVQEDGSDYPASMDLTGCIWDFDNWPVVEIREMLPLDHLPESVNLKLHEDDDTFLTFGLKD